MKFQIVFNCLVLFAVHWITRSDGNEWQRFTYPTVTNRTTPSTQQAAASTPSTQHARLTTRRTLGELTERSPSAATNAGASTLKRVTMSTRGSTTQRTWSRHADPPTPSTTRPTLSVTGSTTTKTTPKKMTQPTTTTSTKTTTATKTTSTTTPSPPDNRDIHVEFRINQDFNAVIGTNAQLWEDANVDNIAQTAQVAPNRIANLAITEGSIMVDFDIMSSDSLSLRQPNDIPTEKAANNFVKSVTDGDFKLQSPPNLPSQSLTPDPSSVDWWPIEDAQTESSVAEGEDNNELRMVYIILICIGVFLILVFAIAIIVIYITTKDEKTTHDEQRHYETTADEEIFITPSESGKDSPTENNSVVNPNFDY